MNKQNKKLSPEELKELESFKKWLTDNKYSPKSQEEVAQLYKKYKSLKTAKALHGAKLNYFKSLKNQCPEGLELHYFRKGGVVKAECGCKKKEDGGEIKKALNGTVANFKEDLKKKQQLNQQLQKPKWTDTKDNELKKLSKKKTLTPQEKQRLQQLRNEFKNSSNTKDYEVEEGKKGIKIEKDCGGFSIVKKFKSARCGSKLKKHQYGGSLNGIPFMLEGTSKDGVLFKENLEPPTLGIFGEMRKNLSQGNEIFGRMINSPATQILLTGIGAGIGGMFGPTMKVGRTMKEVITNPRNAIRKLSRNLNAKKGDPSFRWTKTSGNLRKGTAQEYTYSGMGRSTQKGVLKTGRSEGSGYNAQFSLDKNPTYLRASAPALTQSLRFWNNNRAEPVEWQASRRVMQRNNLIDLARDWRNYIFENPSYGRLNFKVK